MRDELRSESGELRGLKEQVNMSVAHVHGTGPWRMSMAHVHGTRCHKHISIPVAIVVPSQMKAHELLSKAYIVMA